MPDPELPSIPPARFSFRVPAGRPAAPGHSAFAPLLPLQLELLDGSSRLLAADGLLDTGASVNVLPYETGIAPGANWPAGKTAPLRLGGNLKGLDAHPILLTARVADFAPVRLAFAWTRAEQVPLILGQTNFFLEFDVCFYGSRLSFDIRPKRA